jgi:hypothetical protein
MWGGSATPFSPWGWPATPAQPWGWPQKKKKKKKGLAKGVAEPHPLGGGRTTPWGPRGGFGHPQMGLWGWPNPIFFFFGPQGVVRPPPTGPWGWLRSFGHPMDELGWPATTMGKMGWPNHPTFFLKFYFILYLFFKYK